MHGKTYGNTKPSKFQGFYDKRLLYGNFTLIVV